MQQTYTPPFSGAPTKTKVTGYYNPYDCPFHLNATELNRQWMLKPREFVCDEVRTMNQSTGKMEIKKTKLNDPVFESYVGPNRLAREEGKEEVDITWLPRPVVQPIPTSAFSFSASSNFKTDDYGNIINPGAIAAAVSGVKSPSSTTGAAAGYTVEEAIKLGIIRQSSVKTKDDAQDMFPVAGEAKQIEEQDGISRWAPKQPGQPKYADIPKYNLEKSGDVLAPKQPAQSTQQNLPIETVAVPPDSAAQVAVKPAQEQKAETVFKAPPVGSVKVQVPQSVATPQAVDPTSALIGGDIESIDDDLPPGEQPIASVDIAALARSTAAAAGIALPEPKVKESSDQPVSQSVPQPDPAAQKRQYRKRDQQPQG